MKVAIAGFGLEGKSNLAYFRARGHEVTVLDERDQVHDIPEDVAVRLGRNSFSDLSDFDMVVRTAGLAPHKLTGARRIWSATNEFFDKCPAPIVGVTGSKGKGTTCSLITSILQAAGIRVHLVGNIGVPALDILSEIKPEDVVVYELSSFQLWDIEYSPAVAVVLHIEQDHLDVHADMAEYINAKKHIVDHQTERDAVIYYADNQYSVDIGTSSQAKKIAYPSKNTVHVEDGSFFYGDTKICSVSALQIPGEHNVLNACAAIAAVRKWVQDGAYIEKGLSAFHGLPHRLQYVATINEVRYFDDSIATTPGSAIAALNAFTEPKVLILGGSSKGADFSGLIDKIKQDNVRGIVLIGQEAEKLEGLVILTRVPYEKLGLDSTMTDIVDHATHMAKEGDVVILSPSCASFDMFKGYADRGDQFVAAVWRLQR